MNDAAHQRRIERLLRIGVLLAVPLTLGLGGWLLLHSREPHAAPPDPAAAPHVAAFPAAAGPPEITLTPVPAPTPVPASTR